MEERGTAAYLDIPCSSVAIESVIRVGSAGALWSLCSSPHTSDRLGLSGISKASFVAKSVGRSGLNIDCNVVHSGMAKQQLIVNSCIAGAVLGAAAAARTRSWKNVAEVAALVSIFSVAVDQTNLV